MLPEYTKSVDARLAENDCSFLLYLAFQLIALNYDFLSMQS